MQRRRRENEPGACPPREAAKQEGRTGTQGKAKGQVDRRLILGFTSSMTAPAHEEWVAFHSRMMFLRSRL